jgi:hypothetical protein
MDVRNALKSEKLKISDHIGIDRIVVKGGHRVLYFGTFAESDM